MKGVPMPFSKHPALQHRQSTFFSECGRPSFTLTQNNGQSNNSV